MIDSVLIFRSLSPCEYSKVIMTLNPVISNPSNVIKSYTKVKNLRVTIYPTHLVISGSIPKFYTDSYLSCITRQGIENALRLLEGELGISLDSGYVYKLELCQVVYLTKSLQSYFKVFDNASYCKKREYGTSLIFYNKSRSIIIYDKSELIKKSDKYKGIKDNALNFLGTPAKIEVKLKKLVKRQLARFYKRQSNKGIEYKFKYYGFGETLRVMDLYQEDTYNFLYSYWLDTVSSIKINKKFINTPTHLEIVSKINDTSNHYR